MNWQGEIVIQSNNERYDKQIEEGRFNLKRRVRLQGRIKK